MNSAGKTDVKNMKVDVSDLEQYEQMYIDALKALKTESTSIVSKIWIIFLDYSGVLFSNVFIFSRKNQRNLSKKDKRRTCHNSKHISVFIFIA